MVPLDLVRDELARVLQSKTFANTERLRRFLRFIVETSICGRSAELKEYLVGSEALGRGPSFDPRVDAVVRVEARSLRARLERYYADEGKDDRVIIDLPKGRYAPAFRLREPDPAPARQPRFRVRPAWIAVAAVLTAALGIVLWTVRPWRAAEPSIALLPFNNLSSDPEVQYIADGLAEELSVALSRTASLRIAGRVSTAHFDAKHPDLAAIRKSLKVAWVLEGSVRKMDSQLRVTAHLVRARDGEIVWSEAFEEDAGDVFHVEDRIAAAIVAALRPRIEATPPSAIPKPATAEAYDSYLRGRYLRRQMTADGIEKSVAFFEDAIRRDKRYAPAYAALADADAMLGFHGLAPPDEVVPKAREAARQALALDAANAQAHGALGWIAFTYDRNWPAAETEFRLAVQTDRNWPNVRQWFAFGLVARGRFDEAVAQSQKALDLEPLSFITGNDMSSVLYFARRYSESMRNARRGLELDVHASQPHVLIGACLTALGRPTEAVAEFRQAIDPANPWTDEDLMGRLGYAYARSGRRAEALELLDRLSGRPAGATASAFIQLGLGEKEKALALLAQACDRKEGDTLFLKVEPLADPLRGDPRFVALLRKIGY